MCALSRQNLMNILQWQNHGLPTIKYNHLPPEAHAHLINSQCAIWGGVKILLSIPRWSVCIVAMVTNHPCKIKSLPRENIYTQVLGGEVDRFAGLCAQWSLWWWDTCRGYIKSNFPCLKKEKAWWARKKWWNQCGVHTGGSRRHLQQFVAREIKRGDFIIWQDCWLCCVVIWLLGWSAWEELGGWLVGQCGLYGYCLHTNKESKLELLGKGGADYGLLAGSVWWKGAI